MLKKKKRIFSDDQIIEFEEVTSEIFFTLATIIVRFEFCRKFNEDGGLLRVKLAMEHHNTMVYSILHQKHLISISFFYV